MGAITKRWAGFFMGLTLFMLFPAGGISASEFKVGLENLLENHLDLVRGKRLGIIANQTSRDAEGRHIVELLSAHAEIIALFGPEHGFFGDAEDAATVRDTRFRNIQVYSLYGEFLTPTQEMLKDVDVLIYDIQDVGVKFYTFISVLFLSIGAAQRDDIPVIVLDRPNPINAERIEGAVTHPAFTSYVGVIPLPIRYGMTVGELAKLFNKESYAGYALDIELTVIPMSAYRRDMWFDDTGFPWTGTSPNMQSLETAVIYPGMCLLEGSNLSEGRGTDSPFLTVGAPYIDSRRWLAALPQEAVEGVDIRPVAFTPRAISGVVSKPKYLGEACQGLRFDITDRDRLEPIRLAVALLCAARDLYPQRFQTTKYLDKLWGNENLRAMISAGKDHRTIMKSFAVELSRFNRIREKYLIYD